MFPECLHDLDGLLHIPGTEEPPGPSPEPELSTPSEDGALARLLIVSPLCQVHWQITVWSQILESRGS